MCWSVPNHWYCLKSHDCMAKPYSEWFLGLNEWWLAHLQPPYKCEHGQWARKIFEPRSPCFPCIPAGGAEISSSYRRLASTNKHHSHFKLDSVIQLLHRIQTHSIRCINYFRHTKVVFTRSHRDGLIPSPLYIWSRCNDSDSVALETLWFSSLSSLYLTLWSPGIVRNN